MSIPIWAVKGVKVVCVENIWRERRILWVPLPDVGGVYTINLVVGSSKNEWEGPAIQVAELDSGAYGYELRAFRPLVSQQDDLETHFNQYLKTDHRATERERA